jgi:hypothetical protein
MIDGLNKLFEYSPKDPYREHARRLEAALAQLDIAETGLARIKLPRDLYIEQFSAIRNAFSSSALNSAAQHLHQNLGTDVLLALRWAAHVLEDEGGIVDQAELESFKKSLQQQLLEIGSSGLPETVKDFLGHHIGIMLEAIQLRPIQGSEPLQAAVKSLSADIVAHEQDLASASGQATHDQMSLLKKVGGTFNKAAEIASAAGKGAEGIQKVWKLATDCGPTLLKWGHAALTAIEHSSNS